MLLTAAFVALALLTAQSSKTSLYLTVMVLGSGMGLSMLSLLLAVQHGVERSRLGLATSLNQFSRSIGAAIGVAVMGALLARNLSGIGLEGGLEAMRATTFALPPEARAQMAHALDRVFATGAVIAGLGLLASFFLPPVDFSRGVPASAGERMLAAEMATGDTEA
jgi:hypothetical protein